MVSVVRFTVNYFTEHFALWTIFFFFLRGFYSQGLQHRVSWGVGGVAYFRKTRHQSWIVLQMFTSSNFSSPACHLTCTVSRVYTHFICTRGSQINYKCEPSSKQLSGHLFCSLWSHLLSLTLNHTCLCEHIVLHFKHYPHWMGSCIEMIFPSFLLWFFGTLLGKFVRRWIYLVCSLGVYVHTVRPQVNVQLHIFHWQSIPARTWLVAEVLFSFFLIATQTRGLIQVLIIAQPCLPGGSVLAGLLCPI